MSSYRLSAKSVILAVTVIVVIVLLLSVPTAAYSGVERVNESTTVVTDTKERTGANRTDCRRSIGSVVSSRTESTGNHTTPSPPCLLTTGTTAVNETLKGVLDTTVRSVNRTVDTVDHSLGVLNETVSRVRDNTTGATDDTSKPTAGTTSPRPNDGDITPEETDASVRQPTTTETHARSTPTTERKSTRNSTTSTDTDAPTPAVRSGSTGGNESAGENGSTSTTEDEVTLKPTPKAGAAVGLSAVAVGRLLTHAGPATETVSRGELLFSSVRERFTTSIDALVRSVVLFRYSRYDGSDPLEHEGRAVVFEAITETPGIYLSAMSEHTELSLSALRHHLRVLEREQLVMSAKIRGKRRFYPAAAERVELAAALNDEATANVINALSHGPTSVSELAEALDRDPSTVTHHLQRLNADGIVQRNRSGRVVMNRLSPDVRALLTEQPGEDTVTQNAD